MIQPPKRHLPRLAWNAAEAFASRSDGSPRWVAGMCAVLIWLPSLAAIRARGELLADVDGQAAAQLHRVGQGARWQRAVGVGVGVLLVEIVALTVVANGLILLPALWLGVGSSLAVAMLAVAMLAPIAIGVRTVVFAPVARKAIAAALDKHQGVERYTMSSFATWPLRSGHGGRLLRDLLRETDGALVGYPRSDRVARWYVSRGMSQYASKVVYAIPRGGDDEEMDLDPRSPADLLNGTHDILALLRNREFIRADDGTPVEKDELEDAIRAAGGAP